MKFLLFNAVVTAAIVYVVAQDGLPGRHDPAVDASPAEPLPTIAQTLGLQPDEPALERIQIDPVAEAKKRMAEMEAELRAEIKAAADKPKPVADAQPKPEADQTEPKMPEAGPIQKPEPVAHKRAHKVEHKVEHAPADRYAGMLLPVDDDAIIKRRAQILDDDAVNTAERHTGVHPAVQKQERAAPVKQPKKTGPVQVASTLEQAVDSPADPIRPQVQALLDAASNDGLKAMRQDRLLDLVSDMELLALGKGIE